MQAEHAAAQKNSGGTRLRAPTTKTNQFNINFLYGFSGRISPAQNSRNVFQVSPRSACTS